MNSLAPRFGLIVKRLACAAVAVAGVGGATPSFAEDYFKPGQVYGAATLGVLEAGYECKGTPICERTRIGGKLFGGYYFTPNLATEVNYYYLGSFRSVAGNNVAANQLAETRLRNSGASIGLNWSNELFSVLTQHIRFGLAVVHTEGRIITGSGNSQRIEDVNEYITKPYIGLGLSYQMSPHVRFYQGYDLLTNKRNEHIHVLSMGLGIEN
jgi:hypothetical protein